MARRQLFVTLFAFDVLAVGGYDLRNLPLVELKQFLRELVRGTAHLRIEQHVDRHGE
jgi:ATP-dependent DNA ligase